MADGNEVVSVDQLTDISSSSSTVSYGLVKVMTDEQLDEYMNLGKDVPFEFTNISRYITEFAVDGAYEDGVVTITGRFSVEDSSPVSFVVATIPEQYRPSSSVSGTCSLNVFYGYAPGTMTVDPDGSLTVSYSGDFWLSAENISVTYQIDDGAEEPDGIYVVTVQQAVKYLGDISGGGSGGGSDSGGVVLYEGTADPSPNGDYGITGNMSSLNDYSSYVATLRDGTQLTFNEIADTGANYIGMYDTTGKYALTVGRDDVFGYRFLIALMGSASATFVTVYKFVGYK